PSGQQFALSPALPGFDVSIQRSVTRDGQEIDRYGVAEHYRPMPAIVSIGPPVTVTPTATVVPTVEASPTPAAPVHNPTRLAGLNPSAFVLPDGRIRTPSLVGLSENEAQQVIVAVGLATSFVNFQGPGDIPAAALNSVDVGQVLSQSPTAGAAVAKGTPVLIAVRRA
ncbi:MAG TPA: PASTA domain-containing protein, partial [Chloroflexota bacterium]|nr:PASTA domain-containing protein [Chloroflexota bacterium]